MVLMQKPSVIDANSGGAPEKAPRWDLTGTEGCGGGKVASWLSLMFLGYQSIYRRKRYMGGATRGPWGWGRSYPHGRALLPCGRLVVFLTSTPSLLVCFRSKKDHLEGFILFGIPFLQNSKIGKKTETGTGPLLIGQSQKIIYKSILKPLNIQNIQYNTPSVPRYRVYSFWHGN